MVRDLFSVENKVVCISGSSRGLGKALAKGFAERGAKVIISSIDSEELANTKQEFETQGSTTESVVLDVQNQAECQRFVATALEIHGKLDVMICNAGTDIIKPAEKYEENAEGGMTLLNYTLYKFHGCQTFLVKW
ncbi:conserved hypothetical protein [Hyella patelloides LEGE 07179]|uniref:Uncharacterized protein n=1 Tax=Hyella patelloides LEGE 07179 TaxID=945734 RepID=A0A563VPW6_9CYAN|nr:SDR family NAD(P)-dependent oxidoreductase [Hyella patelloides]VEP13463.1 conserved hypothetical protein [Hyella patelloides LEGE 07179]